MFGVRNFADKANQFLGVLIGSTQEQRATGTRQEGATISSNHTAAIDLTNADDDEVSAINPPPIEHAFPPRLPRRHFEPAPGPRAEIFESYPEPPIAVKPSSTRSMSSSRRSNIDRTEEDRLLGSSRQPKDAQPIAISSTNIEASQPVYVQKSKPGAGGAFQPRNTLDKDKKTTTYQGTAGARRAQASTNYPRSSLPTTSSRGQNVPATRHEFPIEQEAKRQKTSHKQTNGQTSQLTQHHTIIDSDSDTEVKIARAPGTAVRTTKEEITKASYVKSRLSPWEPSGAQESRHIDEIIRRPTTRGTWVQQNGASSYQSTTPSKEREVIEVSDHDGAVKAPVSAKKRGRPGSKTPEEHRIAMEGQSRKKVQTAKNAVLSPYFGPQSNGAKRRSNAAESIDIDATKLQPRSLASSVLAALGPGKISGQGEPKQFSKQGESSSVDQRKTNGDNAQDSYNSDDHFTSDDVDELSREAPQARNSKGRPVTTSKGSTSKMKTGKKDGRKWLVEEFIDCDGNLYGRHHFLLIDVHIGIQNKHVRLMEPDAAADDSLYAIDTRHIRGITYSEDGDCPILRFLGAGSREVFHDVKFRDHAEMRDFIIGLKHGTAVKDIHVKPPNYMTKIYGKRHEYSRVAAGDVVDFGVEETLLSRRAGQEQSRSKAAPRSITEGGRRRQQGTLLSLMQMSDGSNRDVAKATSTRPAQKRIRPQKEEEAEDELPSSSSRPVRSTRGRKARSPTPLSLLSFKRYSKDPGLGPPWDQPVVYPETGRKRVTVDFTDLERLDEGEFLNDNLIEFYSRWLQVNRPIKEKTAYFFGTHFYTTVSETPKSEKGTKTLRSNINYKAVERWTAKDDIFDYDFVVVPVNESAHWYLAIICNLPNVQRKLADDGKEVEEVEEASQPDSTKAAKGSESQPVEISELSEGIPATTQAEARPPVVPDSTEIDGEDEGAPVREDARARATKTTPTRGMSQQCHDMKLTSPKPAGAMGTQAASELTQPDEQEDAAAAAAAAAETPDTKLEVAVDKVYDVPDSQPEQIQASQASASVFADAMPPSPEKKRKGKRKSIPRGYDQGQPAIVIIDPMGIGHPRAITVLKDYLIEEARSKRGMEIDRSMFQGLNVNQGIPKQDNYYDCGVFILGYLDKFMSGPEEFGKKLLAKSFDEGADWPEMKSNNMRNTMRVLLQQIAKEQRELRQTKRQEKRAAKKQIAATASSPPGRSNENPVDLSSPSQPRAEGKKDTRAVDDRSSEQRSPSKGSRAPKVPSKVARIPEDDEMILQPHHKPTDQHQPAAEDVEMSQGQERTHISDSDSGDEREVVKPGSEFDIWQDEALASTETRSLVRKSPERNNVQYKIDLEL